MDNMDNIPKISREIAEEMSFHAVISRLISCIVNEHLAQGFYIPEKNLGVLFSNSTIPSNFNFNDIERIQFPLCDVMFSSESNQDIKEILFMDPEDISKGCIEYFNISGLSSKLTIGNFMDIISKWNNFDNNFVETIKIELESCYENQILSYMNPPKTPTLSTCFIDWEQSIFTGHATHPMFRSRMSISGKKIFHPKDLQIIRIRFIAFPGNYLKVFGEYNKTMEKLFNKIGINHKNYEKQGYLIIPVHEYHMEYVEKKFKELRYILLSEKCFAKSQASIRTVVPWDMEKNEPIIPHMAIKLPLGIRISSALRTITPWTTQLSVELNQHWDDMYGIDEKALHVCREIASLSGSDENYDIAKFIGCIIRQDPTIYIMEKEKENVLPCGALVEKINGGQSDTSVVIQVWNLNTIEKRVTFFESYVDLILAALIPPIITHGFAFEGHGQNMLIHYNSITGKLIRFSVRDYGGIKVFQERYEKSTGKRISMLKDNVTEAETIHEMLNVAYHTLIYSHLHRLIRALKLHKDRKGWKILLKGLKRYIPNGSEMEKEWINKETANYKAFIRMKVEGLYRDYMYIPMPNLLNLGREEIKE